MRAAEKTGGSVGILLCQDINPEGNILQTNVNRDYNQILLSSK